MKRLTVRRKDGRWAIANNDGASPMAQMEKIPLAIDRLAAYEDTGLEPEEIGKIYGLLSEVAEDRNCHFDFVTKCVLEVGKRIINTPLTLEEPLGRQGRPVEQARAEGAERLRRLEKQLAAADPNVAEFKVRFISWQEEYQKMMEVLERIFQADAERGAKLQEAIKAALEQMGLYVAACSAPTLKRHLNT